MQQGHFEVVCDHCGSLTIRPADAVPLPRSKTSLLWIIPQRASSGTRNLPGTRHFKAVQATNSFSQQ
jgi:hypothetical protein